MHVSLLMQNASPAQFPMFFDNKKDELIDCVQFRMLLSSTENNHGFVDECRVPVSNCPSE